MYNRYIPQADGSYQRSAVKPAGPAQQRPPAAPAPPPPPPQPRPEPAGSFLQRLLPRNLDTEDLIIILLILLLCGNSEDDRNTAMLTLALYLFM